MAAEKGEKRGERKGRRREDEDRKGERWRGIGDGGERKRKKKRKVVNRRKEKLNL